MIQETTALGAPISRARRRRLSRARQIRRQLAPRTSLQARDERRDARAETGGMGEGVKGLLASDEGEG